MDGRSDFSEARPHVSDLGGKCWRRKRMGSYETCIKRCSKMSHSSIRNGASSALVSWLSSLFPLLCSFSSSSFILPKWAPNESDTAQLMATVVAGRAYLAATAMRIKKRHRRRACEWGTHFRNHASFGGKAANQSVVWYCCSALLGSTAASGLSACRV